MISISIIGTGNVAQHLAKHLSKAENIILSQIYGRSSSQFSEFNNYAEFISDFNQLKPADVLIIAVSDDAILTVSNKIVNFSGIVVHTSGSTAMHVLSKHKNFGVFYPLQTFTQGRELDFKEIPICLEASNTEVLETLKSVAMVLSKNTVELDSEKRSKMHLAAVYANNFTNHILMQTDVICQNNEVSFHLLKPLMKETIEKAFTLGPLNAQTGPAKRKDSNTINYQVESLKTENQKEIYKVLTRSILETYGK